MAKHRSIWKDTSSKITDLPLASHLEVDVAVIGAGITGLTAAYLLKNAGRRVAVLERGAIGDGETGNTTSHLTEIVDTRYYQLLSDFGPAGAKMVATSSRAAIAEIEKIVRENKIDCDFKRVPAYLYAEEDSDLTTLRKEILATQTAGLETSFISALPAPFSFARGALMLPHQAQVHATRYLHGLAKLICGDGSFVYENSPAIEFSAGEPCLIQTPAGKVSAGSVLFAAHHPISTRFVFHTKIAAYRSYAVAGPIAEDFPDGLFWDLQDPYHYTRTQRIDGRLHLIVGGEDHKTGHEQDTGRCFRALKAYAKTKFGMTNFTQEWSGQILEPVDGLPYIGRIPLQRGFYTSTGYSGNGMTFGTIGALVLTELILGRESPWAGLYEARRIKPLASGIEFITENSDVPKCLIQDYLLPAEAESLREISAGEGKIVKCKSGKLAVFRDEHGHCHALSPVCPHMACHVRWNGAERSWDCPCHGSRFDTEGKVLNGPATSDLARAELDSLDG